MFNQNIMNNNFNQNHPQMMQNIELENNQNHFYLIFVKNNISVPIPCRLEEKFSDVIARYKNKTNSQDNNEIFIFNSRVISPDVKVNKIDTRLLKGDKIIVTSTGLLRG